MDELEQSAYDFMNLKQGKMSKGGLNEPPKTPRPTVQPMNKKYDNNLVDKIRMWRKELERQNATQGTIGVFDTICTFLGEQQREIQEHCESKELLGRQVFALTKRVDELQKENSLLCPIGDISVIESLKAEKQQLMEKVDELEHKYNNLLKEIDNHGRID